MKNLIVGVMIGIIISAAVGYYYVTKNNINLDVINYPEEEQVVGGDKDEHGCIGSAGYSWCEERAECIRIWEKDCLALSKIKAALIAKDGLPENVVVTIREENANYAVGGVKEPEAISGGAFMAAKAADGWKIVYSGNGSVDCEAIKSEYDFSPEMLSGFCD